MDNHYSPLARTTHWLSALAIVVILTLGYMMLFAEERAVKQFTEAAHIGVGFFVFWIVLWRVIYRLQQGFPNPARPEPWRWLSRTIHYLLLVVMLVLVFSGPLYLFTEGEPLNVFGWFTVAIDISSLHSLHEPAEEIHKLLGIYVLPMLLGIHILGGIKQFYQRR